MKRDPIAILGQIRQAAVTEAGRALAAALAEEARCGEAITARIEHLEAEQRTLHSEESARFATWLPRAQSCIAMARRALHDATLDVTRCRSSLSASRADAEAVATLLEKRAGLAAAIRSRQEQAALDEAGAQSLRRRALTTP